MTAVSTILSEPEAAIDPVSLPQWQADSNYRFIRYLLIMEKSLF